MPLTTKLFISLGNGTEEGIPYAPYSALEQRLGKGEIMGPLEDPPRALGKHFRDGFSLASYAVSH